MGRDGSGMVEVFSFGSTSLRDSLLYSRPSFVGWSGMLGGSYFRNARCGPQIDGKTIHGTGIVTPPMEGSNVYFYGFYGCFLYFFFWCV